MSRSVGAGRAAPVEGRRDDQMDPTAAQPAPPAPAELLQMVVDTALAATTADSARLLLLRPDGLTTEVAAVAGRIGLARGRVRPLGEGLGGWVLRHRRPLLVRSISESRL